MSENLGPFTSEQIMGYLPHRYPFLFVDRIESLVPAKENGQYKHVGTKIVGIKAATVNEPYFVGHFPGQPITPGVVLIETMAQVGSFSVYPWVKGVSDKEQGFEMRLVGVDGARFRKPVVPGDVVRIYAEVTKYRSPLISLKCRAESAIDGSSIAECELLAMVNIFKK